MSDENQTSTPTFSTVSQIIGQLEPLNESDRQHVLRTVSTWFRIGLPVSIEPSEEATSMRFSQPATQSAQSVGDKFSNRPVQSVKEFIFEKDPVTESERLACLAYYLTHYMETPHFKTIDLSRLNTDAAQRKLSNPAVAAGNATRDGFFVQAPKDGFKQLSAMGERFVQLLPDRDAASKVRQRMSSRRKKNNGKGGASKSTEDDEL